MSENKVNKIRRIIRLSEVEDRTKLSPSWIYAQMKAGKFPLNFKIFEGGRACGWFADEIDAFIESRGTWRA